MRRDHLGLGVSVGRCLLDFLLRVPGRLMFENRRTLLNETLQDHS